jgi:hypothetical protein
MSIKEAAAKLANEERIVNSKNIVSIGVGSGKIYIYTRYRTRYLKLIYSDGFEGYPVEVKQIGRILPL